MWEVLTTLAPRSFATKIGRYFGPTLLNDNVDGDNLDGGSSKPKKWAQSPIESRSAPVTATPPPPLRTAFRRAARPFAPAVVPRRGPTPDIPMVEEIFAEGDRDLGNWDDIFNDPDVPVAYILYERMGRPDPRVPLPYP